MIKFNLNNEPCTYSGDSEKTLLNFLRLDKHITSAKDGCSGQAVCGACTVEIDGKAKLACVIKMKTLEGTEVYTTEGFPEYVKDTIAKAFVNHGAVQCGFCSPGFVVRTKVLLQDNPNPSIEEIQKIQGGSISGVKSRLQRGREKVLSLLNTKEQIRIAMMLLTF